MDRWHRKESLRGLAIAAVAWSIALLWIVALI